MCIRQTTLLGLVLLLLSLPRVEAYGICRITFRCANGGVPKYGQSIYGPCRCICSPPFTGPRCQYRELIPATKRSSFDHLADILRSSLAEERQQKQQQQQQEDEMLIPGEDVVTEYTDEEQPIVGQRRNKRLHPR